MPSFGILCHARHARHSSECPLILFPIALPYTPFLHPARLHSNGTPLVKFAELHIAIHLAHKYQCPDV